VLLQSAFDIMQMLRVFDWWVYMVCGTGTESKEVDEQPLSVVWDDVDAGECVCVIGRVLKEMRKICWDDDEEWRVFDYEHLRSLH